ncbi:MAG: ATP-binding protein, partial [Bacteroidales bacterium]|nr:ATP-binding protein [Bacteroidales bacterium]
MKLCAFRIRNFRSITDTGWQNLSPDNITCLIGQNESGKTSILEGLRSFYTGSISEDVLRSDLSLPEISCRFNVKNGWLSDVTENPGSELKELLSELTAVELTRTWLPDFSSTIKVSGRISEYLDSLENAWGLYLNEVKSKLEKEIEEINKHKSRLDEILSCKADIIRKADPSTGKGMMGRMFRKSEGGIVERLPADQKHIFNDLVKEEESVRKILAGKKDIADAGLKYNSLLARLEETDRNL